MGLALASVKKGDAVCLLYRADVPFILRPVGKGQDYELIGEAYCHGLMEGEGEPALEKDGKDIRIIQQIP